MANPKAKPPAAKAADQEKPDPAAAAKPETTVAAVVPKAPETDKVTTGKTKLISVIAITAVMGTFRRLGMPFSKEPQYFEVNYFDRDEIQMLMDEPNLNLTQAEVDPDEVVVLGRPEGKPDPEGDKE